MAPGAAIVGALSDQAPPTSAMSIFANSTCASTMNDPACQEVDARHAVSFGTSFSSPIVAGTVAVMLQHDPTLTQDAIVAALQGGAHALRGPAPYGDQAGPGEVDVIGALGAVDRIRDSVPALPVASVSWLALGAEDVLADGSTPVQAILELRSGAGSSLAPADGFAPGRLSAYARVDGVPLPPAATSLVRRGPGVWVITVTVPSGLGGSTLSVGATFDGADVVTPRSVPIATDVWNALYPPRLAGGCSVQGSSSRPHGAVVGLAVVVWAARRRRARAAASAGPGRLRRVGSKRGARSPDAFLEGIDRTPRRREVAASRCLFEL
jgi:Subtilase family